MDKRNMLPHINIEELKEYLTQKFQRQTPDGIFKVSLKELNNRFSLYSCWTAAKTFVTDTLKFQLGLDYMAKGANNRGDIKLTANATMAFLLETPKLKTFRQRLYMSLRHEFKYQSARPERSVEWSPRSSLDGHLACRNLPTAERTHSLDLNPGSAALDHFQYPGADSYSGGLTMSQLREEVELQQLLKKRLMNNIEITQMHRQLHLEECKVAMARSTLIMQRISHRMPIIKAQIQGIEDEEKHARVKLNGLDAGLKETFRGRKKSVYLEPTYMLPDYLQNDGVDQKHLMLNENEHERGQLEAEINVREKADNEDADDDNVLNDPEHEEKEQNSEDEDDVLAEPQDEKKEEGYEDYYDDDIQNDREDEEMQEDYEDDGDSVLNDPEDEKNEENHEDEDDDDVLDDAEDEESEEDCADEDDEVPNDLGHEHGRHYKSRNSGHGTHRRRTSDSRRQHQRGSDSKSIKDRRISRVPDSKQEKCHSEKDINELDSLNSSMDSMASDELCNIFEKHKRARNRKRKVNQSRELKNLVDELGEKHPPPKSKRTRKLTSRFSYGLKHKWVEIEKPLGKASRNLEVKKLVDELSQSQRPKKKTRTRKLTKRLSYGPKHSCVEIRETLRKCAY